MSSEWTSADLDSLRALAAEGLPPADIARRMAREPTDVEERLAIIRARRAEPSGPDEEGETPLGRDAISDDRAAWVHIDEQSVEEQPVRQTPPPPD